MTTNLNKAPINHNINGNREVSNIQPINPTEEVKKYDLVFIGGGPATIAFICYIFQHKLNDKVFPGTNILIIEKGENFGSGCLGYYGINTNTSSEGFPRIICQTETKENYSKDGLSPSRKPMKVSKNYNDGDEFKVKNKYSMTKMNKENANVITEYKI